jgi:16S rRNA (guanine(966)-N(2))-methyltransferase RsmD
MPPGLIRPAMDRMRESVFAVLGGINGQSFLDLFTGSGIIALEAASRGALPVEAVEMDKKKCEILLKNVSIAPIRINCRFMSAELYVRQAKQSFDYIFCDPPFPYRYKRELAASVAASVLLNSGGILMMHHPREDSWADGVNGMMLSNRREYGRSIVDFWRKDTENASI